MESVNALDPAKERRKALVNHFLSEKNKFALCFDQIPPRLNVESSIDGNVFV